MSQRLFRVAAIAITCIFWNCASRTAINMVNVQRPASFSSAIILDDKVLLKDRDLLTLSAFAHERTFWSLAWIPVQLGNNEALVAQINSQLQTNKADGILNLEIVSSPCIINNVTGLLTIVPLMPTCLNVEIKGEFVKKKGDTP